MWESEPDMNTVDRPKAVQLSLLPALLLLCLPLSAGAFYRWNDAVVPVLKLDMYAFGLGLSYDANTSKLRTASTFRGGLEVTLSFRSFLQIRNGSLQRTKCPIPF
jgi:hypothetical protein